MHRKCLGLQGAGRRFAFRPTGAAREAPENPASPDAGPIFRYFAARASARHFLMYDLRAAPTSFFSLAPSRQ